MKPLMLGIFTLTLLIILLPIILTLLVMLLFTAVAGLIVFLLVRKYFKRAPERPVAED